MPDPKLISIFAGSGQAFLLQYELPGGSSLSYWLVDGGPITSIKQNKIANAIEYRPFTTHYEYLRDSILRLCRSGARTADGYLAVDLLQGITSSAPERDLMDGLVQILSDWLPDATQAATQLKPIQLSGPVITIDRSFISRRSPERFLTNLITGKGFVYNPLTTGIPNGLSCNPPPGHVNYELTPPPQADQLPIDPTSSGVASVITIWNENDKLPIFLAGTASAVEILYQLNTLPLTTDGLHELGIFQGSSRCGSGGSLLDPRYEYTPAQSAVEADQYFFQALVIWYLAPRVPFGPMRSAFIAFHNQIITDLCDNWISKGSDERTRTDFFAAMSVLSRIFLLYLHGRKFFFTPTSGPPVSLDPGDGNSLPPTDFISFANIVLGRYNRIIQAVYTNDLQTWTGQISNPFTFGFESLSFNPGLSVPIYQDLVELLRYDPFKTPLRQAGIISFYQSFRANNYIVSPDGEGLCSDTIAGLMIAAITNTASTGCRVFFNEGAAIPVDKIRAAISSFLTATSSSITTQSWRDHVRMFFLDQDYFASIPLDQSPVPECTEAAYDSLTDNTSLIQTLSHQLQTTSASSVLSTLQNIIPSFAAFSLVSSTNAPVGWLTLDVTTKAPEILDAALPPPIFMMTYVGRTDAANASGRALYKLTMITPEASVDFPDSVIFERSVTSLGGDPTFNIYSADFKGILAIGSASLDFQVADLKPFLILTFHVQQKSPSDVISPSTSILSINNIISLIATAAPTIPEDPIPSQESFLAWWTRSSPGNTNPTLADIANVALGPQYSANILARLPDLPFVFGDVETMAVDLVASPAVTNLPDGSSIISATLTMKQVSSFGDLAGLGSMPVQGLQALFSTSARTFSLGATLAGPLMQPITCSFLITPLSPLEQYLKVLGITIPFPSLTFAQLFSIIVGPDLALAFLSSLPQQLYTSISLPTWLVSRNSNITFYVEPFGVDVPQATIIPVIPTTLSSVDLGVFTCTITSVLLDLEATRDLRAASHVPNISFGLKLGSQNLDATLRINSPQSDQGPGSLDVKLSSPASLQTLFSTLGFATPLRSLSIPVDAPPLQPTDLLTLGLTAVQTATGVMAPYIVQNIYFPFDFGGRTPWVGKLPVALYPTDLTKLDTSLEIRRPKESDTWAVGVRLNYSVEIVAGSAQMQVRAVIGSLSQVMTNAEHTTQIVLSTDETSNLAAPSLDAVLSMLSVSWDTAKTAIPTLGKITTPILVKDASLDVLTNTAIQRYVAGFSTNATINQYTLMTTPQLVLDQAKLTLIYTGTLWSARVEGHVKFGDKYRCFAKLVLPTQASAGTFEFESLDPELTLGLFAQEILPTLDITTIPVIGAQTLANVQLRKFSLEAAYVEDQLVTSSFEVGLEWGGQNLGQVTTVGGFVNIIWQTPPYPNIPSVLGPGNVAPSENAWLVEWQSQIRPDLHLRASTQFSEVLLADGSPQHVTTLNGGLLNTKGDVFVEDFVNWLSGTADVGPSTLWHDTMPSQTSIAFNFKRLVINCGFGPEGQDVYAVGGRVVWGKETADRGLLVVQKDPGTPQGLSPWAFAFSFAPDVFEYGDIIPDWVFANLLTLRFPLTQVAILAYRFVGEATFARLQQVQIDASNCPNLIPSVTTLSTLTGDYFANRPAGIGIVGNLDTNVLSAVPDFLMDRFRVMSNSTLEISIVQAIGIIVSSPKQRTITFCIPLGGFSLSQSLILRNPWAEYGIDDGSGSMVVSTSLQSQCSLFFPGSDQFWTLSGGGVVTQQTADLVFVQNQDPGTLMETLGLKFTETRLSIHYDFGVQPAEGTNAGVVHYNDQVASFEVNGATASVALGDTTVPVTILFDGGSLTVFDTQTSTDVSLGTLSQAIFSTGLPTKVPDFIELSEVHLFYAWTVPTSGPAGNAPRRGYQLGFHGEAFCNTFGVSFDISLDIMNNDATGPGVHISGSTASPLQALGLTFQDSNDASKGPSLDISTCPQENICVITGKILLFGTPLLPIGLLWNRDSNNDSLFRGTALALTPFAHGGATFEIIKTENGTIFRLSDLPATFNNIVGINDVVDNIKNFSSADGRPCGPLVLAFDAGSTTSTTVDVHIQMTNPQPGQKIGEAVPADIDTITFDVSGLLSLHIGDNTISNISFGPLTLTTPIPTSFLSFGTAISASLKDSASLIVKGLWDDKARLADLVKLVQINLLSPTEISTLICRGYRAYPSPNDPSGVTDGGVDGDGYSSNKGGTAAAAAALAASANEDNLTAILIPIVGETPPLGDTPTGEFTPPTRLGPLSPPDPQDTEAQAIYDALNKDFTRWSSVADFQTSLTTALQCALDYRSAISLLRQSLNTPDSLSASVLSDYQTRLTSLIFDFSSLSNQFGSHWLGLDTANVHFTMVTNFTGRQLDIKWNPLAISPGVTYTVTVYGNDTAIAMLQISQASAGDESLVNVTPFSIQGTVFTAKVVAFAAAWGGSPAYAFYSQGKPGTAQFVELPPTIVATDRSLAPTPPQSVLSAIGLNVSGGEPPLYPVLKIGSYVYWAFNYQDNRNALAVVAYDQNQTVARVWVGEGTQGLATITIGNTIDFIGQDGTSITFMTEDLLSIPFVVNAATTKQPNPMSDLVFFPAPTDSLPTCTVVLLLDGRSLWPMNYTDGRLSTALVAYDSAGHALGRSAGQGTNSIGTITIEQGTTITFRGSNGLPFQIDMTELLRITSMGFPMISFGNSADQPPPPEGLKYDTLNGNGYPIISTPSLNFWALSYTDNRAALAVLAYNSDKTLVGQVSKSGTRYIASISFAGDPIVVNFIGQGDASVTFTLEELASFTAPAPTPDPSVLTVLSSSSDSRPSLPAGLRYLTDSGGEFPYPVLAYQGLTFWPLSYLDNRGALALVAFNNQQQYIGRFSKEGARYIARIEISGDNIVCFGQDDLSVTFTLQELKTNFLADPTIPTVATGNINDQPEAPSDCKYAVLNGGDINPVLKYGGITYWALSFIDNRLALQIIGFDKNNNVVGTWTEEGARYIARIETSGNEVKFYGQGDMVVVMTLSDLTPK